MLRWLMRRRVAAFERAYDNDVGYLREIMDADPGALLRVGRLTGLAQYRRDVPAEAYFAAKIAATSAEDCGPCTQLAIAMAERAGCRPEVLRAIAAREVARLPHDAALGLRFADSVLRRDPAAEGAREEVLRRWGKRALVSLAFAVTAGRLFPTLKYALGHGAACAQVRVAGETVALRRAA
ncbi:MAG: hypothetical protein JOY66_15885 [Acetobacteraceae bacterium]|nr:hypothetical protein [Acetobacteraceae bacterium]